MTQGDPRAVGYRTGLKRTVQWLHEEAARMNDPKARTILNDVGFSMSAELLRDLDINAVPQDAPDSGDRP